MSDDAEAAGEAEPASLAIPALAGAAGAAVGFRLGGSSGAAMGAAAVPYLTALICQRRPNFDPLATAEF
jgi:hypothetical protein